MIRLSRPDFWHKIGPIALALYPFSLCYRMLSFLKKHLTHKPIKLAIPVICIGNITAGGAGKTPLAIEIGKSLLSHGIKVAYLTRGFGGNNKHHGLVDLKKHNHTHVGDEAIMLASIAPTYVGSNRSITGKIAQADGVEVIIMDDGMQHHSLYKDLTILTLDADYQFGNRMTIPSGPLRQTVASGLSEAEIIVCTSTADADLSSTIKQAFMGEETSKPCFMIKYMPVNPGQLRGKEFVGLCSIASPNKFIQTAEKAGAKLIRIHAYPDHYAYTPSEIDYILASAKKDGVKILTTSKDAVKMSPKQLQQVVTLELKLLDENGLINYLLDWI